MPLVLHSLTSIAWVVLPESHNYLPDPDPWSIDDYCVRWAWHHDNFGTSAVEKMTNFFKKKGSGHVATASIQMSDVSIMPPLLVMSIIILVRSRVSSIRLQHRKNNRNSEQVYGRHGESVSCACHGYIGNCRFCSILVGYSFEKVCSGKFVAKDLKRDNSSSSTIFL